MKQKTRAQQRKLKKAARMPKARKTRKNEVIDLSNESDGEVEGGLSQELKLIEQKEQQAVRVKEEIIEKV